MQVMLNVLAYKMTLPDSMFAPRIHHQWYPDLLSLEVKVGSGRAGLAEELRKMGHAVKIVEWGPGKRSRFGNIHNSDVASRLVHVSISKINDEINGVFIEPTIGSNGNVEYLMSLNGLLVQAMISLGDRLDEKEQNIIERVITYYSLMGKVLEDRLWDAVDWDFTENYVAYLAAIDQFDPD